jgi:predicted TIM-barrel fold metal-dependent hydrolase
MEKVDAHVHVFDRVSEAFPREESSLAPAGRAATVEQLLREMDGAGIDRAVLIQMGGFRIEHHRYVTRAVSKWGDRFAAVGLVDVNNADPPAGLQALYEATGIAGVRLMGRLGDPGAAKAEQLAAYGLFQRAERLGLNINLYCQSDQIANIEMLVRAFPGVHVSLDHLGICPATTFAPDRWGRPRFDEEPIPPPMYPRILDLARYPNVYVKVSGEYAFSKEPYPYADMRPMVERIYHVYGAERMMWCSDFPWIVEEPGYRRLVALLDRHLPHLTEGEKAQIAGGNALEVWFGRQSGSK